MAQLGLILRGELVRVRDGKEWTDKDGTNHTPGLAVVTTNGGESSVKVEYRTLADAEAAVGTAVEGDVVELRVFPRSFKDRIFYGGQNRRNGDGVSPS